LFPPVHSQHLLPLPHCAFVILPHPSRYPHRYIPFIANTFVTFPLPPYPSSDIHVFMFYLDHSIGSCCCYIIPRLFSSVLYVVMGVGGDGYGGGRSFCVTLFIPLHIVHYILFTLFSHCCFVFYLLHARLVPLTTFACRHRIHLVERQLHWLMVLVHACHRRCVCVSITACRYLYL